MSDRQIADVTYAARLKAAHIAQIDILMPRPSYIGRLGHIERVHAFANAAEFDDGQFQSAVAIVHKQNYTAAAAVWSVGLAPLSLFANLPGCGCPVQERFENGRFSLLLIPSAVRGDWNPNKAVLEDFARIQQEARLGEGA
jgi:hypothetical protein